MKSCINHHSKCETSLAELLHDTIDLCLRIFVREDFFVMFVNLLSISVSLAAICSEGANYY